MYVFDGPCWFCVYVIVQRCPMQWNRWFWVRTKLVHQFARNYIYAWFFFTFPKNDDCWMPMCTATAAIYILYKQPRKKLLICVAHLFSMPCVAYLSNSLIANGYCSIQALTFVCLAPHSPSSRHTAKKNKKWRHTFLKSQRRFLFIHLYTYKVSSLYIYIYPW